MNILLQPPLRDHQRKRWRQIDEGSLLTDAKVMNEQLAPTSFRSPHWAYSGATTTMVRLSAIKRCNTNTSAASSGECTYADFSQQPLDCPEAPVVAFPYFPTLPITMSRKLRGGVAGLGRMSARRANHFHALTPRADLRAASSPESHELK